MAPGFPNYLTVEGCASVVEGGAPAVLRRIMTDYFGTDSSFPPPGAPEGYVIRIRPRRLYGVGPWEYDDDTHKRCRPPSTRRPSRASAGCVPPSGGVGVILGVNWRD